MSDPASPSTNDPIPPSLLPSPIPMAIVSPQSLPLLLPPPPTTTQSSALTNNTTPSTNPRRLPPPCWSHDETIALIDAYRDKWYTLRRGNLKATHWQEVADAVSRRCPTAMPSKTAVQCRHKMEKLRKRYRTEIQRARSMPISRFSSSWVHFKRMDAMEKGPTAKPDYNSDSPDEVNDEDEEEDQSRDYYDDGYKNDVNTRSVQRLYNRNGGVVSGVVGGGGGGGGGSSGGNNGFRIRIPTGVSIAQPGPRFYGKIDQKYTSNPNSNLNSNSNANFAPYATATTTQRPGGYGGGGTGSGYPTRVNEGQRSSSGEKREREEKDREKDPMSEMVTAIKMLGDGFVKMEQMKMEMAREIEAMRMEMEMKRTEMILDSQHRIVEAFAKVFSDQKKKPRRMSLQDP